MAKDSQSCSTFDAVLILSFGGPQGLEDIRPFIENVTRGRQVPPKRIEEVARRYELFGGKSPITELTSRQAEGLRQRLKENGPTLPVYVGMAYWHPFIADTLREMAEAGVRRAVAFITAPHQSEPSCGRYQDGVARAREELISQNLPDIEISYVDPWHDHSGFIATNAKHIRQALDELNADLRSQARIIFTAHSIPLRMAQACQYREQLAISAKLITEELDRQDWALVYESRSGQPEDPWLEPDICDYLRAEHDKGLPAAVILPLGFVYDHLEVVYDLDHQAAAVCRELNLPMVRAKAPNDDPIFIDMMADVIRKTCRQD